MVDSPAYTVAEAARHLKIAPATLRSWVIGRTYPRGRGSAYFEPLIEPADAQRRLLSFHNLIEAYVLRSLRQEHGVSIKAVRMAIEYAQTELGISRLLLSPELLTTAGELFIQRYGELINLSRSGQLALRKVFEAHLQRIDWRQNMPVRLYPYFGIDQKKLIAIDPTIQFGRPVLLRKGILTSIIADRIDAGELPESVAADYDLAIEEVELAIIYERAA